MMTTFSRGNLTRFSLQSGTRGVRLRGCFFSGLFQYAFGLGRVGCDRVHQRRAQAIVRLELELFQTGAHLTHALGLEAGFDDRGYKRRERGSGPATLLRKLGVHEIETVERVVL